MAYSVTTHPAYRFFNSTSAHRDQVFKEVADLVKPVRMVEAGATRLLSKFARFSDGWASVFFSQLPYLLDYHYADPDLTAREITRSLLTVVRSPEAERLYLNLHESVDGIQAILNARQSPPVPTLVYLDGPNDRFTMKDQAEWCDLSYMSILCDDLHIKGEGMLSHFPPALDRGVEIKISFDYPNLNWQEEHSMLFIPSDLVIASAPAHHPLTSLGVRSLSFLNSRPLPNALGNISI